MSTIPASRLARRAAVLWAGFLSLAAAALIWVVPSAGAAELVYWDSFGDDTVAVANIDGTGGALLNLTGAALEEPEGIAYDPVTNRLIVGSGDGGPEDKGAIVFVNLDGSGAGLLNTAGAPVDSPYGVVIDPGTRRVYWLNGEGQSVAYASLDGSGGAELNTAGATFDNPFRIGIDPVGGKVYWGNSTAGVGSISYANTDNSGGGELSVTPSPEDIQGFAVDPAAGRIYWVNDGAVFAGVSSTGLAGGARTDVLPAAGTFRNPYGIAVDPVLGRVYWGNYDNNNGGPIGAIGFANLAGGGGAIDIAGAPVKGPQDPLIIKSPASTVAPAATRSTSSRSALSCSTGEWGPDYPSSYVYQSPRSFAYQWTLGGAPIAGATASTRKATKAGSYACVVTATNQAGSTAQTSAPVKVKAAKIKLSTKKKATAKAGGLAKFKVKEVNQGDLQSKKARVCVKLSKGAKGVLKAPKCKNLGKVKGRGKGAKILKLKVAKSAEAGTYKVTFTVHGNAGKSAKAKVLVK